MPTKTKPAEHGMLFTAPLVRAIGEGLKTQTRRPVTPQPPDDGFAGPEWYEPLVIKRGEEVPGKPVFGIYSLDGEWGAASPYGGPGDLIYVRENFYIDDVRADGPLPKERPDWLHDCDIYYPADAIGTGNWCCQLIGECCCAEVGVAKQRPSIHMPKWAARYWLEIADVRVERVQEISWEDAAREGIEAYGGRDCPGCSKYFGCLKPHPPGGPCPTFACGYREHFCTTWNAIYADKGVGWNANPWVWVYEFKKVEAPND